MQHLINATDKTLELKNGQIIFPGQAYVKPIEAKGTYNEFDELMKLKKEDLQAKAEELGIEVKPNVKKEDLANAILDKGADA